MLAGWGGADGVTRLPGIGNGIFFFAAISLEPVAVAVAVEGEVGPKRLGADFRLVSTIRLLREPAAGFGGGCAKRGDTRVGAVE